MEVLALETSFKRSLLLLEFEDRIRERDSRSWDMEFEMALLMGEMFCCVSC